MKYLNLILLTIAFFSFNPFSVFAQADENLIPKLTYLWETEQNLPTIESVIYDPKTNFIYTTNIDGNFMKKDGKGSISKVSLDGKIIERDWIKGLDAPTGTGIYKGKLYVTDIDRIHEISIKKAKILKTYKLAGAKALNDIEITKNGTVYASDTGGNQIFSLRKGKIKKVIEKINTPNGLLMDGNDLLVTSWSPKTLNRLNLKTKKLEKIADGLEGPDGIEAIGNGGHFVSGFNGYIHYVAPNGSKRLILNTSAKKIGAADIDYIPSERTLLIPTFNRNSILAFKLSFVRIEPILVEKEAFSGIGLRSVTNAKEPNRKLFQKNLFRGKDISVYIVSSERAMTNHKDMGIDEFIYLINGSARMKPNGENERFYNTGEFFLAPKGYSGEWETLGATKYHYELSVITTGRTPKGKFGKSKSPYKIDSKKLSGQGLTKIKTADGKEFYRDELYKGIELELSLEAEEGRQIELPLTTEDQLIYVIAGKVTLTANGGKPKTFYTGDFFIIPRDFKGTWESKGHHLFRSLRVKKTKN